MLLRRCWCCCCCRCRDQSFLKQGAHDMFTYLSVIAAVLVGCCSPGGRGAGWQVHENVGCLSWHSHRPSLMKSDPCHPALAKPGEAIPRQCIPHHKHAARRPAASCARRAAAPSTRCPATPRCHCACTPGQCRVMNVQTTCLEQLHRRAPGKVKTRAAHRCEEEISPQAPACLHPP